MQEGPSHIRLSCEVDPYHDKSRLIDFLTHRFSYPTTDVWEERLASGRVLVNGRVGTAANVIVKGDRVEYVVDVDAPRAH